MVSQEDDVKAYFMSYFVVQQSAHPEANPEPDSFGLTSADA